LLFSEILIVSKLKYSWIELTLQSSYQLKYTRFGFFEDVLVVWQNTNSLISA